jgi:hypothetical protein
MDAVQATRNFLTVDERHALNLFLLENVGETERLSHALVMQAAGIFGVSECLVKKFGAFGRRCYMVIFLQLLRCLHTHKKRTIAGQKKGVAFGCYQSTAFESA